MKIRLFTLTFEALVFVSYSHTVVFLQVYKVCSHKSIYTKKLIELTIPATTYVLNATASLFSLIRCVFVGLWAILAQIVADLLFSS